MVYTDATKQKIEKIYTVEEGIRYGDHAGAKAREGRELQKQRIINNTITKSFLRLVKADEEFIKQPGEYIKSRGSGAWNGTEERSILPASLSDHGTQ